MTLLLGFVDEIITENYASRTDHTTNKLGGYPNYISEQTGKKKVICKVCGSVVPLLLQIYAPITERYQYHRTLYIFACINPNCWGNSKSWICLKQQTRMEEKLTNVGPCFSNEDWYPDANNWECDIESASSQIAKQEEAASLPSLLNSITVFEENANEVSQAFVDVENSILTAEIEPDENEPITLDSPIIPTCNIAKLLKQKPTSPQAAHENIHFMSFFIYAMEEKAEKDPLSEHVQNLLMEYSRSSGTNNDFKIMNNLNFSQQSDEKYEKSHPLHGDKLFHTFMSRIKMNPDQILRYCRNSAPLFLYPEINIPSKCQYCHGDIVFEMQILSTIINYLKLSNDKNNYTDCLEFSSAFVYTCKNSCDQSDDEYIIVQTEKT